MDMAMDDAGDADCEIDFTSFILAAELLTRKLAIQLGSAKHILPEYVPALQSQPGRVPDDVAAAVRLPEVDGAAVLFGKVDGSFMPHTLELRDSCGSSSISILHFPHSYCGPPPDKERMFRSSRLDTCASRLSLTSRQPSQVVAGSLLFNPLPDPMLLHMEALLRAPMDAAILDPFHDATLPKMQKLFSGSPAKTPLWQFSKRSMPLRLATCLRKILPSSRLHMSSSLSFTSLQPSHVVAGSLLSNRLPDPMLLHVEALLRAPMDAAILDPFHDATLPKMQKLFSGSPAKTPLWTLYALAAGHMSEEDPSIFSPPHVQQPLLHFPAAF